MFVDFLHTKKTTVTKWWYYKNNKLVNTQTECCFVVIGGNYISGSPIQQYQFGCLGMCGQAQKIPFDLVLNERRVDMVPQQIAIFKPVWGNAGTWIA